MLHGYPHTLDCVIRQNFWTVGEGRALRMCLMPAEGSTVGCKSKYMHCLDGYIVLMRVGQVVDITAHVDQIMWYVVIYRQACWHKPRKSQDINQTPCEDEPRQRLAMSGLLRMELHPKPRWCRLT